MNTNPFELAPPLRSTDGRWAALASCSVAIVLVTSSMFSPWLGGGDGFDYRVGWTAGAGVASCCWFFSAFFVAGLGLAMIAGRRRSYLPVTATLWLLVVSTIGSIGMVLVLRQAAGLHTLPYDGYEAYGRGFYHEDHVVHVAQAAWNGLTGFVIATIASARLWRLGRRQAQQSRTALALINAQLAVAAGDVVVEDDEPVELVPTV
jgi:hypothetical protein